MCLYSFFILILLYDNPVSVVRAWGPVESGCSQRQLSYQMSIFRSSLIVERVWLSAGHGRAQPPPGPHTGHALSPLKVVLPRQSSNAKGKVRYQELISNSAGAWRGLQHFCWEQKIPTHAVCREFVREDRNERRGRLSLNVEEMTEYKEICDHTDQTNSVWWK